jgi:uroporphyrin-3 C-methyltransferase
MENKMTDKITEAEKPTKTEEAMTSAPDAKVNSTTKSSAEKAPEKITPPGKQNNPVKSTKSAISKTALLALLISLLAVAGLFAGYLFMQKQQNTMLATLKKQNQNALQDYQNRFKSGLQVQQTDFNRQLEQTAKSLTKSIAASRKKELYTLSESVENLQNRVAKKQPSDWLVHEAEYLIRIASRSLWMEKDTASTINLLKDADARLAELNSPPLLPIRQLIHQDIKALEAMPQLATDYIVLTLMALNKEVPNLLLTFDNLTLTDETEQEFALSENISDWRVNLNKSWEKFFNDFIRVRHRTGAVEPLMSPQEQVNLKNNLALKVQLAIWAASQRKTQVYIESLNNIELWLNRYFDMSADVNKKFLTDILQLKEKKVDYDYPTNLTALTAITKVLKERTLLIMPSGQIDSNNLNTQDKTEATEKQDDITSPFKVSETKPAPVNAIKQSDKTDIEHDKPQNLIKDTGDL